VYIGTDTRASGLLLGALFATAPFRTGVLRVAARVGRAFTGIAALVVGAIGVSWFVVDGPSSTWLFRGGLFVHSLLSAVLVAACAARPAASASRWIGWTPLRITGVLSYSLYLWHWPVFALLSETRTGMSGWPLLALRFAVSFGAAAISKVAVEDPVRFRAAWARGRPGVAALAGVSAAIVAFWVVVPRPQTAPAAFSLDQLSSTTALTSQPAATHPPATSAAVTATTGAPATTTAATTTTIPATTTTAAPLFAPISRVLMVGDSMAFDEWPAVASAMFAGGIAIGGYVSPGAGLLDTRFQSTKEIEKMIVDFRPDLVLYQGSLWDAGTTDAQRAAYEAFTDFVLDHGARLGFITILPLRADHQDPAHLGALTGIMHDIAATHSGEVFVLNSDEVWGPVFTQDVNGDKAPERKPDGVHVCPSGAAMFAIWLTQQLQERFEGFVPAPAEAWATGEWIGDPRYIVPEGICAALP
jgi:hypothetical protein